MLFNSLAYLLLLGVVRAFEILTRRPAIFVLLASLIFYLVAGVFDTSVFIVSIVINWLISKYAPKNKIRIIIAIFLNMGLLTTFKYLDFILGAQALDPENSYIDIALPLGISFYTFQILAYQIDVVRGTSKEAKSFKIFALFVAFFPQLIAGPIVRSKELLPQIERLFEGKRKKVRLVSYGLALFLLGLFKKVIIADSISPFVDEIFIFGPESLLWAWVGATLFAFQIYCDFSGYSDMAIGSAYLLGIKLPTNFKTPYLSKGPRDFWQRWHITLSTWIRDYLYIPLGGSHGSIIRSIFVVVLTMGIAGLWHGADITFVIWGAVWGAYIAMARLFIKIRIHTIVAVPLHFIITVLLWVLFRASNWDAAIEYYQVMLGMNQGENASQTFYEHTAILPILVCTIVGLYALHFIEDKIHKVQTLWALKRIDGSFVRAFLLMVIILIILLPRADISPFIYFRF